MLFPVFKLPQWKILNTLLGRNIYKGKWWGRPPRARSLLFLTRCCEGVSNSYIPGCVSRWVTGPAAASSRAWDGGKEVISHSFPFSLYLNEVLSQKKRDWNFDTPSSKDFQILKRTRLKSLWQRWLAAHQSWPTFPEDVKRQAAQQKVTYPGPSWNEVWLYD